MYKIENKNYIQTINNIKENFIYKFIPYKFNNNLIQISSICNGVIFFSIEFSNDINKIKITNKLTSQIIINSSNINIEIYNNYPIYVTVSKLNKNSYIIIKDIKFVDMINKFNKINTYNIYILCSGKSGSTTLYDTFINNNYNCIKVHNDNEIINDKYTIFESIELSKKVYDTIYIIDCYRNPIERKISSFFQNIHVTIPNYKNHGITNLMNDFNNIFLKNIEEYHSLHNILLYYNIPIYDNFIKKEEYIIYKFENIVFIKLKFKYITNWNNILSSIFNKNINTYKSNISDDKEYNQLYTEFKNIYKIPKSYLLNNLLYDSEFIFFNSKKEIDEYYNFWLNKSYDD